MSTLNDAFWHKGQRSFVGSRMIGRVKPAFAKHASHVLMLTAVDIDFTVSSGGAVETLAATASIATATGTVSTDNADISVTDDGSSSTRIMRQLIAGQTVAAATTWYVIATVNAADVIRLYMGEAVATAQTPKRPVLNLENECPFGQVLMDNTTNPFIYGTTAHQATGVTATFSDIIFIPAD